MSAAKPGSYKGLTEARKRANKKYNDRFVEIKVRVTPEKRSIIKELHFAPPGGRRCVSQRPLCGGNGRLF